MLLSIIILAGVHKLYQIAKRAHGIKKVSRTPTLGFGALYPPSEEDRDGEQEQVLLNPVQPEAILITSSHPPWQELVTYPFQVQRRLGKEFHRLRNNLLNSA